MSNQYDEYFLEIWENGVPIRYERYTVSNLDNLFNFIECEFEKENKDRIKFALYKAECLIDLS